MTERLPTTEMLIDARVSYITEKAREIGVEPGWLWLYRNGFKRRVPKAVKEKIEKSEAFFFEGEENDDE